MGFGNAEKIPADPEEVIIGVTFPVAAQTLAVQGPAGADNYYFFRKNNPAMAEENPPIYISITLSVCDPEMAFVSCDPTDPDS